MKIQDTKVKVAVAMSGGVDSSVAALLLKQKGYKVTGITMKIWDCGEERSAAGAVRSKLCCSLRDMDDARAVAAKLDIPHYVVDIRKEFEQRVVRYFCENYSRGVTPNPCVVCNKHIKFGLLLDKIKAMGFTYLATGHYAQVLSETVDGKVVYNLTRGVDEHKDQSYWLYELNQKTLPYILLPLGGFTKTGVRICAKNAGLPVAEKKESQEVCFVTGKKYAEFVVEWLTKNETKPVRVVPGDIINTSGKVLGKHKGILYYTIGQRQGLGVSAKKPLYVTKILVDKNMVVVGDETELYTSQVDVCNINWIVKHPVLLPLKCMAKIRYQHKLAGCVISTLENDSRKLRLKFDEPQRAVTPGQSAVFYSLDGNTVLGGGII